MMSVWVAFLSLDSRDGVLGSQNVSLIFPPKSFMKEHKV